jgi:hypothetical protein
MIEQLMDNISNEEHERLISISEHAIAPALSPAAQAVLDAAEQVPIVLNYAQEIPAFCAAALRAAADHLFEASPWPGHIESTGVNWSSNQLFMIADELEAHG